MTLAARIARNHLLQVAGKLAGTAISLLVVALTTRYLREDGFGQYATVLAYVAFFAVLADLGISITVVGELTGKTADRDRAVGNLLGIRIVASLTLLLVGALLVLASPYPLAVRLGIAITTLTYFFAALTQFLTAILQVRLRMWPAVVAELAGRVLLLAAVYVGVTRNWGLEGILCGHALAGLCSLVIVAGATRGSVRLRPRYDLAEWRTLLAKSAPIGVSVILTFTYGRLDTLCLSLMQPADAVGRYAAAYKVLEVAVQFPIMLAGLVLPTLASARRDPQEFNRLFRGAFEAAILTGLPVVVTGMILAEPILRFVAGDEFASAANLLRILMCAGGMLYVSALTSSAALALQKQRQMVPGYFAAALAGIALYATLIPKLSAIGAAIGTVVTEAVVLAFTVALVLRSSRLSLPGRNLVRSIPATIALAATLFATPHWPLVVRLACGALVYMIGLLIARAIPLRFITDVLMPARGGVVGTDDEATGPGQPSGTDHQSTR